MEVAVMEIKKSHGKVRVQATGQNARGRRYIKGVVQLTCASISDPDFKAQMAEAVKQIADRTA